MNSCNTTAQTLALRLAEPSEIAQPHLLPSQAPGLVIHGQYSVKTRISRQDDPLQRVFDDPRNLGKPDAPPEEGVDGHLIGRIQCSAGLGPLSQRL
jgi:hypothetical protein